LSELDGSPHHRLSVDARLGALHLRAQLEFAAGWTVIFGPSGSGKSSLLRAACGLLPRGTVEFAERSAGAEEWTEVETRRKAVPPHLRRLAYAPQGAVLFPHLSVRENVAFPLTVGGRGGRASELVDEAMALFELGGLGERMPRALSGGEGQRVNLARAFAVPGAGLMLLDEPFTGIDRAMREMLVPRMREWLVGRRIPVVSVTHDVEEALMLEAEVVRLVAGQVTAQGAAREVLAAECGSMLRALA
jgi:molybdate transport system ATP-binding protein